MINSFLSATTTSDVLLDQSKRLLWHFEIDVASPVLLLDNVALRQLEICVFKQVR